MKSRKKYDSTRLGAWLGAILPLVFFGIMLLVLFLQLDKARFVQLLVSPKVLSRYLCLATLSNAVFFFIALRTDREHTARGVLALTIIYALIVFLLAIFV